MGRFGLPIGILVAFGTAMTACLTLLILPVKYIYELQHRASINVDLTMKSNNDFRSPTESSSYRNDASENERDKLLIQPIVRTEEIILA